MSDLHAAIMNLSLDPHKTCKWSDLAAYLAGHRDARHAAAELVSAALSALAVPPGWVLVPVEPTPEMLEAAVQAICYGPEGGFTRISGPSKTWRAMLAAAPQPKEPING